MAIVTGTDFERLTKGVSLTQYNALVRQAVDDGAWVRWPQTIVAVPPAWSGGRDVRFVVCDDYFAIGTDVDFVRVPLDPLMAQELADRLHFVMPTPRMVDLIWLAAAVRLEPLTGGQLTPPIAIGTHAQDSPEAFWRHSRAVDAQKGPRMGLTAGHKKDVVLSNRLLEQKNRVCIYGWHRGDPKAGDCSDFPTLPGLCPIQGVSIVHEDTYRDYAHGIRMVSTLAVVDGQTVALLDAFRTLDVGPILNGLAGTVGAPLQVTRQPPHVGPGGSGGQCSGFGGACPTAPPAPPPDAKASSGAALALAAAAAGGLAYAGWQVYKGRWR